MSLLKLEEVRLSKYDTMEVPAGFQLTSERKGRRAPVVSPWNWYARYNHPGHFVVHKLTTSPQGITIDELKALMPTELEKAEVDKVLAIFRSGSARFAGWDLAADVATGTRFMLIYRDPREFYAKEQNLTIDLATVEEVKPASYVTQVPALLAIQNAPLVEKAPKAPRAPKAEGATGSVAAAPAVASFMAEYAKAGLVYKINATIANFVDAASTIKRKGAAEGDSQVNVREEFASLIDKFGLEGPKFVDFIAYAQKESAVKAGFYKGCKELAKEYNEFVKAQTAQPVAV